MEFLYITYCIIKRKRLLLTILMGHLWDTSRLSAHPLIWRGIPLVRRDVSRLYNCTPSRLAWHSFHFIITARNFSGGHKTRPYSCTDCLHRFLDRLLHRLLDRLTFRLLHRLFAPIDVPIVAPIDVPIVAPSEAENGSMAFFDDVTDMHKACPYVSNGHSWRREQEKR